MSGCSTHKGAWKLAWEENFNQKEHFDTAVWSKIPRGTADWQKHMSDYDGLYAMRDGNVVLRGNRIEGCRSGVTTSATENLTAE